MKSSFSGLTSSAAAMAAAFGLSLIGPHRAGAAPTVPVTQSDNSGPAVTILSPVPRTRFSGDSPIEISAFYQGASSNQIASIDLYVDGVKAATKNLSVPEMRGVVSFLLPASELASGTHRIVVRATAADAEVTSAKSSFVYVGAQQLPIAEGDMSVPGLPAPDAATGQVSEDVARLNLASPAPDSKVQGTVKVEIQANAVNGKRPYVSLFVDREFKDLKNYPPYEFEWDTSNYSNGLHTIEVLEAFDDPAQNVAHLKPVNVYVNNPGGLTSIRHDLLDGPKPVKSVVKSAPKAVVAQPVKKSALRPMPQRRPGPALLASAAPAPVPLAAPTHLAKGGDFVGFSADAGMTPALSNPFLPAAAVKPLPVTPAAKPPITTGKAAAVKVSAPKVAVIKATAPETVAVKAVVAKALAPKPTGARAAMRKTTAPVNSFRPLSVKKTVTGVPVMAGVGAAQTHRVAQIKARLMQMAQAGLSSEQLSSPFLAAPVIKESVAHVAVAPLKKMVAVHTPATASTPRLIYSEAHNALIFNSKILRLERPIAARHSVMFGPLRQVFEYGGGSLLWESRTGTVRLHRQATDIKLTIGQKNAVINQRQQRLDAAPYLSRGRTMVPVSFLPTALDANVHYDPQTGNLLITSNK